MPPGPPSSLDSGDDDDCPKKSTLKKNRKRVLSDAEYQPPMPAPHTGGPNSKVPSGMPPMGLLG